MHDLLLSGSGEEGFGSSAAADHQRASGLSHQTYQTKKELKALDRSPKWLLSQKKLTVLFINQRFFQAAHRNSTGLRSDARQRRYKPAVTVQKTGSVTGGA